MATGRHLPTNAGYQRDRSLQGADINFFKLELVLTIFGEG